MLLVAGMLHCLAATRTDRSYATDCYHSAFFTEHLCTDELNLFKHVDRAHPDVHWGNLANKLSTETIKTHEIDELSALFFLRSIQDPKQRQFREDLFKTEKSFEQRLPKFRDPPLLSFVPGMFFRDHPESGADGRSVRQLASLMGFSETMVPVDQTGTIEQNGATICEFIKQQNRNILLVSVSKGSADVREAFALCGTDPAMRQVMAWLNIGGLLQGSYLINQQQPVSQQLTRLNFFWKGYNYGGLKSLKRQNQDLPVFVPRHMRVINVVAAPLDRYVSLRARPHYETLKELGPNDGLTLARDAMVPGALTYVTFRSDHYFRLDMPAARIAALLALLIKR